MPEPSPSAPPPSDSLVRSCVYTVLMGGYERLTPQPAAAASDIPFICFTDDAGALSGQVEESGWQVREVPRLLAHDARRSARAVKLLPHEHLAEFRQSLYIDNSVRLEADPRRVFEALLPDPADDVGLLRHSFRRSLLDEFLAVVDAGRDDPARVYEQLQVYATTTAHVLDSAPWWGGLLARRHTRSAVVDFGRRWLAQVLRYSTRDQLSAQVAAAESGVRVHELAIDNHRSRFHRWPVGDQRRVDRAIETSSATLVPWVAQARAATVELGRARMEQVRDANTLELARRAVASLAAALDQVVRERDAAVAERDAAVATLDGVLDSRSWRVTAPLRRVRNRATPQPGGPPDPPSRTPAEASAAEFERRMAEEYARGVSGLPTRTPLSFRHKVWMRRAFDRRPVLRTLVDKVQVRGYVAERVGERYLPTLYGVYDDAADLGPAGQPERFALRSAHASGGVVLAWDGPVGDMTDLDPWWRAAFPAGDVPWDTVRTRLGAVLDLDYGDERLEWAYRGVPRRLVAEELLVGPDGGPPSEYLFFTFDGVPRLCLVAQGRFVDMTMAYRTMDFEPVHSGSRYPLPDVPPERPREWEEMAEVAGALGAGLDMVRVDLFVTDRGVRVGELTVYPAGGTGAFDPPVDDLVRGALWTLPPLDVLLG